MFKLPDSRICLVDIAWQADHAPCHLHAWTTSAAMQHHEITPTNPPPLARLRMPPLEAVQLSAETMHEGVELAREPIEALIVVGRSEAAAIAEKSEIEPCDH
ncbi:hypothetical protein BA190_10330 [Labrys sp. WJW]|nr:hypothetical protein BA190_10330 [Labrys sp. WJW]